MKPILNAILDRLLDLGASLDALEAELVANGQLNSSAIARRFESHKATAASYLTSVRAAIASLPD